MKMWSALALTFLACGGGQSFVPEIPELPPAPLGLDPDLVATLGNRPVSAEKVALGWQLFYDSRLSKDGTISCASCHVGRAGFADPRQGSVGVGGAVGDRNAPTVINAAFNASQSAAAAIRRIGSDDEVAGCPEQLAE